MPKDDLNQLLSQLLEKQNDSELARHLHHDLCGLRASLESSLQKASQDNDPGVDICKKLINKLNQLLHQLTPNKNEQPQKDNSDHSTSEFKLKHLREAFLNDETLPFRNLKLSTKDSDLWNEIQRLLLRVSPAQAEEWRDRAQKLAQEVGVQIDERESAMVTLPYKENKLLYPGLTGTVQAKGLYLSTTAPLDKQLPQERQDGDLKFLAQVVSICLYFIEEDSSLHHCLKSIYRFGVISFDSNDKKSSYARELIDRFQYVHKFEDNPIKSLHTRLDLDEAIHSLVYLPPVETDSWWHKLQTEARKTLNQIEEKARKADDGHSILTQWLRGPYENVTKYTQMGAGGNLALKDFGTPGQVLVCLRVYAKLDREDIPGRVLYCP